MTDVFTSPDDGGDLKSSDFSTSMVDRLGAQWADTLDPNDSLSGMWIGRQIAQGVAGGEFDTGGLDVNTGFNTPEQLEQAEQVRQADLQAIPDISRVDAQDMLKQEGLTDQDVHLGDAQSHKLPVLKMQIAEAHTRRDRAAAIARGPQGFFPDALGTVTSIGVGMIDPVNAAAFSIPVLGEARMGKILMSAGDSIAARGAVRFGQGAAQGAVGTAVLQPADWWLHTRDGQDYTMAQAMESVITGAGMGGAFHGLHGGVTDYLARRQGLPLPGSPQDLLVRGLMTGTHVPASALVDEGVPIEQVPGIGLVAAQPAEGSPIDPPHPAEVLADLPTAARQDAVHAAMADVIAGRPTQAAEMLGIAADHDPRIADSFEAWHGSPHDFDRFDISKLGSGEGAQAFGHGLYLAENEKVARGYQRDVSEKVFIDRVASLYDEGFAPDDAWAEIHDHWDEFSHQERRLMTALHADDWLGFDYPHQAVNAALHDLKRYEASPETAEAAKAMGHMYRVQVNANPDHFLDWDEPIGQQSEHVRQALGKLGVDHTVATSGEHAYQQLSTERTKYGPPDAKGMRHSLGDRDASAALRDVGIPGIKYLDQKSRGIDTDPARLKQNLENWRENLALREAELAANPGDPEARDQVDLAKRMVADSERYVRDGVRQTRNYVVFDDKNIEITHKNGEPVKHEDLAAEHQMLQAKAKGLRGRAAADPRTWSLFEFLASKGGLKPDPELRAIFGNERGPFVPGFGPLLRKSGATLDEALTRAKEGGYLIDPNDLQHVAHTGLTSAQMGKEATLTPRDLLDHIDDESRGRKVYRADHEQRTKYDPEQEHHVILGELEHEMAKSGAKVEDIDPELLERTVEIVKRGGETDVLAAYERPIMEDAERYDATAHGRQSNPETGHIPGWDAADGGATPRDGEDGAGERRQARRPDQGPRAANGAQSSGVGRGNRSSPAEVAADPRWRALADATPDYNEPEILAESEQAAHTPEPTSVNPQKSLSALEKAARDAEEVWRQLEPTLSEDERRAINDAFASQQVDRATRDQIIVDGAACLTGAFA